MTHEQLLAFAKTRMDCGDEPDILVADCDITEFMLDNCEITVPEENTFFVETNCYAIHSPVMWSRNCALEALIDENGFRDGFDALAYTGNSDFSHTYPDWHSVIDLGFVGLKKRVEDYAAKNSAAPHKVRFYTQTLRVYNAIFRFLHRAADAAEQCGRTQMAEGLRTLTHSAPQNLYEAMQMSIAYYFLHYIVEGTYLRTLGRLDQYFNPFFSTKEETDQLAFAFLHEIDRLPAPANMPFAIGGTDLNGKCAVNEMSYVLLDAYRRADTSNTKFHILCSKDIPQDIVQSAFASIRAGKNSIVFVSDSKTIEMLEKLGIAHEDAVDYYIVGCYEPGGNNETPCTGNGRVSIPKALEYALNGGVDLLTGKQIGLPTRSEFATFAELYDEFKRQLLYLCGCAMEATDLCERQYSKIHAAPLFSSTFISALERGGDIYCDNSARYCNSSINGIGLATATDSLAAIRKLVYEDKTLSLQRLKEILNSDWAGEETLRLMIRNKFPKYGMGDHSVDALAAKIAKDMADFVNQKPNGKGGVYRLGLLSINWRWEFGEKAGASADGRLAGETLSQNISATFGADRQGATAHLLSTAAIDYTLIPNGTVVDIDLHASAAKGEKGLQALMATLKTYFQLGGFAVHYNVLDTEILEEARRNPEKYRNLQVRLCGWNALFTSLSDWEQLEFIARSQR